MQIKNTAKEYDVIIVGSGAGGGMATKILSEAGAIVASTPIEVAEMTDRVICLVETTDQADEVICGANGIIHGARDGNIVICMSTIDPLVAVRIGADLDKKNIKMLDAPVSGGEVGAINGVLSIMIGGPNNKIPFLKKIMSAYSKSIVHIGPSGHGQLTKMVNQLCIAGLIQALSEGISLGQSAGLNMNKVLEAISNGAAQSWQMDNRFKTMIKKEFDFGFAVSLMIKDLKIALNEAQDKNLDLQISNIILQNYKKLLELGDGTLDTSSLIKLIKT